jgi:sec-independent protein translocase protein TatB
MFNLDPGKLLVIAVVAIILLGPDRLPQVARQVGAAWRSFNEFRHRMESEVRSSMPDLPPTSEIARLARSPSALLNHLSNMSEDTTEEPAADGAPAAEGAGAAVAENGADHTGVGHDGAEGVSGNGTGVPAADNGSAGMASPAGETTAPLAPLPQPAARSPQEPVSPLPETAVPGDPSLN